MTRSEASAEKVERSAPRAVVPRPVPEGATLDDPALLFNRELSEIDFNWRVLHQGTDERVPLLERVRFLAITASNLDEFIQKRVGGLKRQEAAGVRELSPDGRTPGEQLALVRRATTELSEAMGNLWEASLRPLLAERAGVWLVDYDELEDDERVAFDRYFEHTLYPILTPLAVDQSRPFPLISNLSLSLAVTLHDPTDSSWHFARVKVPTSAPRWLPSPRSGRYLPAEQLIARHIGRLFPGMSVHGVNAFRVVRNAYLQHNEEVEDDLIEMMSEALREQRFAPLVRLEVEAAMPVETRRYLMEQLGIDERDVVASPAVLRLADCAALAAMGPHEQRYEPWRPQIPRRLAQRGGQQAHDIFSTIRDGDILVHHPYDSYDASVLRLLREAANDPRVVAIKQTLYRTAEESQTVAALLQAAERGKQVAVLVEIKARFDERANIEWGQKLEDAGVHVAYGLPNLKTHAKVMLVVRHEDDGLRCYCHVGTGNYHEKTAQVYTDLGLLTCREEVGRDLVNLFHFLTGHAPEQRYDELLVAPRYLRRGFCDLLTAEIAEHERAGGGRIVAKMNGLDDVEMIRELYRASQAGVQVDLLVRGACRLRPGVRGISDHIRVVSIIGRFLEHDRIFWFRNGGEHRAYIGSADWRRRNLSDRIEAVVPIADERIVATVGELLEAALRDNRLAWDLDSEGRYVQRRPGPDEPVRDFQRTLMAIARGGAEDGQEPPTSSTDTA